jgi:hypothetical protein
MLEFLYVHFYIPIINVYFYFLNSKFYKCLEIFSVFLEFIFILIITTNKRKYKHLHQKMKCTCFNESVTF